MKPTTIRKSRFMPAAVALLACLVVVSDVSGQGQPGPSPASSELSPIQAALGKEADTSGAEEARKHMDRGLAAFEMAKNKADYRDAILEFQKARELAPRWPEVHFNLGLVLEEAEQYSEALASLKQYLRLAPGADDAATVKSQITKIEYKLEKIEKEAEVMLSLLGTWVGWPGPNGVIWVITLKQEGDALVLYADMTAVLDRERGRGDTTGMSSVPVLREGKTIRFKCRHKIYNPNVRQYLPSPGEQAYELTLEADGVLRGKAHETQAGFMKANGNYQNLCHKLNTLDHQSLDKLLGIKP